MVIINYFGEIWKDIPDYEGYYQASNYGRVRSLNYNRTGKEQILKLSKSKGYLRVMLSKHNVCKSYLVHRLVWVAFHGEIPEGYEINHINEVVSDNRLENLELVSHRENINWGTRNERAIKNRVGKTAPKPVVQYDLDEKIINIWESATEAAKELGYNQQTINMCCLGKRKRHRGYIWKYK